MFGFGEAMMRSNRLVCTWLIFLSLIIQVYILVILQSGKFEVQRSGLSSVSVPTAQHGCRCNAIMRLKGSSLVWMALCFLFLQCYIFVVLHRLSAIYDGQSAIAAIPVLDAFEKPTSSELATVHVPATKKTTPLNQSRNCTIPNDWLYPLCEYKVKWLKGLWTTNKACYIDQHKLDPKDDCSILIFLSEVEAWCPLLPWRKQLYTSEKDLRKNEKVFVRRNLTELFQKMNDSKYQWMRDRIGRLWPHWMTAARSLAKTNPTIRNRKLHKIFLYMGSYSYHKDWLERAYSGVPLGEMVQWSDLIASLYVLGHSLNISSEIPSMKTLLNVTSDKNCARRLSKKEFDLIYTDYVGVAIMRNNLGPTFSHFRCRLRILDSFGTDPEFNYAEYKDREKIFWGGTDVHARQLMTMFPHSPDNLFLGFVVDKAVAITTEQATPLSEAIKSSKRPVGLVYGKDALYFQGREKYIEILNKYVEIHATVNNQSTAARHAIKKFVPDVVINHGILKGEDLQALLRRSKVFIGLAFPYEGPAPLEAISQGCVFLNAKLNPPLNRANSDFFKGKPTSRELTSQHPYMETFIGKPHVYTIDINDLKLVERTIKEITALEVKPFLPYEWTTKGMLERVNIFVEKLDFCEHGEQWPPFEELRSIVGAPGTSCKDECEAAGLLCESSYFRFINTAEMFRRAGISCQLLTKEESLSAPSYKPADQSCNLQAMSLLFSCVAKDPSRMRVCPCRDYQSQQVAFCKKCR